MLNGTFTIDGFKFPKSDVAFLETNLFNKCPEKFQKLFSQVRLAIQTLSLNPNVTIQAQFRHDADNGDYYEGYAVSMGNGTIAFFELNASADRNTDLPKGAGELQRVNVSSFRTWFDDTLQPYSDWTYRNPDNTKHYDVRDLRLLLARLILETDSQTALWAMPDPTYRNASASSSWEVYGMVSREDRPLRISFAAPKSAAVVSEEAKQISQAEKEIWSVGKAA